MTLSKLGKRDGVYVPDKTTFTDGYKICKLPGLLSKTREVAFDILNRTVWTNNKAHKSGTRDNPDCQLCGDIETMEHLITGAKPFVLFHPRTTDLCPSSP